MNGNDLFVGCIWLPGNDGDVKIIGLQLGNRGRGTWVKGK